MTTKRRGRPSKASREAIGAMPVRAPPPKPPEWVTDPSKLPKRPPGK
jgi:hypothetical protein